MKSLEHILKSETENLQDLTDAAVQQTEELWSQVESSFHDLDDKGREFLRNSSTVSGLHSLFLSGYNSIFFFNLAKGNNFYYLIFMSLDDKAFSKKLLS